MRGCLGGQIILRASAPVSSKELASLWVPAQMLMQEYNLPPQDPRIWFAQLYGMSDDLSYNLANGGLQYGQICALRPSVANKIP